MTVGFAIEGMAVTNAALYDKSGLKCKIRYHKNDYASVCTHLIRQWSLGAANLAKSDSEYSRVIANTRLSFSLALLGT